MKGRDSLRVVIGARSVHNRPVVSLGKPANPLHRRCKDDMFCDPPGFSLFLSLCQSKEEKPSNSLKLELNGQPGQPSRTSFVI